MCSVKYMRPEGMDSARAGISLRTLVYHQIIISYLAYVKARGFTSMFIWACPPLQVRRRRPGARLRLHASHWPVRHAVRCMLVAPGHPPLLRRAPAQLLLRLAACAGG